MLAIIARLRKSRRRRKEPEPPWRRYRSDWEPLVLVQWDGTQPATPSFEQRPPVWLMLKALLNNARSAIIRNVLRRRPPPPPLDEHDFPVTWRVDPEDPDQQQNLARSAEHWPIFERWCEARSLKPFPASAETTLRFLLDPPVEGPELYETWWAISIRHEAYYWMEDADPYYLLKHGHGVDVEQDGTVVVPDEALHALGL